MAWRLSRYQTFVSNTTVITAAFLNAVQDAILDLFNGNYTVKKFQADGTGDAAPDGTLAAGDIMAKSFRAEGNGDDGAAIKTQTLNTTGYKCLWQILCVGTSYTRIYSFDSGILISYNTVWNVGTSKFNQEDAGLPSLALLITANGLAWQYKPLGSAPWDTFLDAGAEFASGTVRHYDTISSSTVGAGQAVTLGQQYLDTTPIAWGYVNSGGTLQRGANIKSCAETAPGSAVYTIELQNKPANFDCTVASLGAASANGGKINVIGNNGGPGLIQVETYNAAGVATSYPFAFVVFGG